MAGRYEAPSIDDHDLAAGQKKAEEEGNMPNNNLLRFTAHQECDM